MASNLLKIHVQTTQTANLLHKHKHKQPWTRFSSSSSTPTPPTSKEAAIFQAKTCLSTTLEKPLNNTKLTSKLKRLKQPRFRLEIPVIDDSPDSLSQLAFDIFRELPIKRKGSPVNVLIIWPNAAHKEAATKVFESSPNCPVEHADIASFYYNDIRSLSSTDVAVFLAVETSQLEAVKSVSDGLYPRPVVMFNPRWGFDDESEFGEMSGFVGSFEVIYSFMGLEVKGVLSKRKGVIFKCVRDGVVSGEKWFVLVEEEGGELKVISTFKVRPSIAEVENVLYNLMAMNSPVTKSVQFFTNLVSNVTGKK